MQILVDTQELLEIKSLQIEILNKLSRHTQNDELISLDKAGAITGMEYQTLRQMFLDGKLSGKRFGRAIRLSKTNLLSCNKK